MQNAVGAVFNGPVQINDPRQYLQGQLDTELSEVGVEQARAAAQLMKNLGVSKIVSSDLTRARHTAEIIAASLGLELTHDAIGKHFQIEDTVGNVLSIHQS